MGSHISIPMTFHCLACTLFVSIHKGVEMLIANFIDNPNALVKLVKLVGWLDRD